MDRNVYAERGVQLDGDQKIVQPKPAEKLLKYFPAEAFALYAALEPASATVFEGRALTAALWISLLLSLLFCVIFLKRFWVIKLYRQIVISCVTFVVYVAALGGPFSRLSWFEPGFALIASIVVTGFIIFVKAPVAPSE